MGKMMDIKFLDDNSHWDWIQSLLLEDLAGKNSPQDEKIRGSTEKYDESELELKAFIGGNAEHEEAIDQA